LANFSKNIIAGDCSDNQTEHHRFSGWPDFFIVGAANSGTTSLYMWLNQHPQIFLPPLKEPHYFSQVKPSYEQRYLRTYVTEEKEYLKLFRKEAGYRAVGETSSSYLFTAEAPLRIRHAVPNAKVIFCFGTPWSVHNPII
jgi:Sulfotransferase family